MKPKGSKFARKHNIIAEEPEKKLPPVPPEYYDFFENQYGFTKRFLNLYYDEQVELISYLYKLSSSEDKEYAELSDFYIQKIHELTDSDYEKGVYEPVAVDEKRLIRMDCYGSISRRRPDQLSDLYRYFQGRKEQKHHLLRDYDLDSSPFWKVMAQFESFRRIAPKVKRALYKAQINPDALKVMTVNDYCDLIYKAFAGNTEKSHFIKEQESVKNRFIRQFMKECGDSFYRLLIDKGIDERCVKSLCNKMKRFGSCNLDSLIVTENHYTPRVLKDLKKAGFDTGKLEVGMPIPEEFINYLVDNGQEKLILARNDDGSLVNPYQLPRLEVHHGFAVKFADADYLAASNYPDRLVLIEANMHRGYYHLFDSLVKQNNLQNYYSRLNINNKYMRLRIGFSDEDALYGDFENTPAFRQRAAEDKKHRANYFECQKEYDRNVIDIMNKYAEEFRQYGPKKMLKNLPKQGSENDVRIVTLFGRKKGKGR